MLYSFTVARQETSAGPGLDSSACVKVARRGIAALIGEGVSKGQ